MVCQHCIKCKVKIHHRSYIKILNQNCRNSRIFKLCFHTETSQQACQAWLRKIYCVFTCGFPKVCRHKCRQALTSCFVLEYLASNHFWKDYPPYVGQNNWIRCDIQLDDNIRKVRAKGSTYLLQIMPHKDGLTGRELKCLQLHTRNWSVSVDKK